MQIIVIICLIKILNQINVLYLIGLTLQADFAYVLNQHLCL